MSECRIDTIGGKLCHLINYAELVSVRFMAVFGSLLWGTFLLIPGDSFSRPMFSVIINVMPEEIWGTLFIIQGMAALYTLFYGYNKKILLVIDSVLGCFLWTCITIGMLLSTINYTGDFSPPAAASIIFMLSSWWLLYRFPWNLK